ncbi:LPS export ABC transporter ATP-binding protein [Deinococcus metallilatus]|uniref:LPS export ABC transporter ATP-binding protein n=1 Tax=Deinococcus metallilatus TaxID=1211322 RepID=A0AAJ5F0A4_9DEIO|nr:LPS export ABC transporter ATP-binding protein [Deinococcus metallilatus]MBB5297447.1 lipopolysaccharide export system ATP-binding protein [Deinococcus metallilatus]QBY08331.1 LPS export ABC transporter ATP-binding protein [Deinococcus metallilatus]RXJ11475.1 LPS export ABC transporter ATP-binding protein [Deinococcus metallilatus]TLK20416.1 LPS export ABC transporter ATP-binding protein [Deinococcus metallilatus]GMA17004.1 ABC transporter ATP-binding protein [Deinococcus metallilatus]
MTAPAAIPTVTHAAARPELTAQGLSKTYGRRQVVRGVDFTVRPGEIVALFGPNGAGKTTTFYMVVGFIRPGKGSIVLGDRDVTRLPMHERARLGLGYLPQEPSAFRKLTARDNLLAILEYQNLSRAEQEARADALLAEFGLTHLANSYAYQLSGGERRRLELARALTTDPDYLLLDEPFTGVDPKSIREIQRLIRELRDRRGIGVFITDHNVRETIALTDRVYLMFDGEVKFQGTPQEFARDQDARRHYLGDDFEL